MPLTKTPRDTTQGMTLLEIMIVVAIISALATLVVPRISNQNTELKGFVRRFSTLSKQLQSYAKLNNSTYRLVMNLGGTAENEVIHQYWVERAAQKVLVKAKPGDEREEEEENKKKSPFEVDKGIMKNPKELPRDLKFDRVEITGHEEPYKYGLVYIHYFPEGRVEEAAVHLKHEGGLNWTLITHPLTGKMDVVTRDMDLEEVRER